MGRLEYKMKPKDPCMNAEICAPNYCSHWNDCPRANEPEDQPYYEGDDQLIWNAMVITINEQEKRRRFPPRGAP